MELLETNLYDRPLSDLISDVKVHFPHSTYDFKKHVLILNDENHDQIGSIRLPLHFALNQNMEITSSESHIIYLSLESGYAAICMVVGGEIVFHTTQGAYMTRKKQGFSQIKYLNKKGKSRAGSRVRLASTIEFFEKTNLALSEVWSKYEIHRIALNCTKTLLPYLFQSKVKCPFGKDDPRLYKIPLHIPQSNYHNLQAAVKKLNAPILFYQVDNQVVLKPLIQDTSSKDT